MSVQKIRVLLVKPETAPQVMTIGRDFASMYPVLDTDIIQDVPLEPGISVLCDEEGKLKEKPYNRKVPYSTDWFVGDFLIVACGNDGNYASLSDEDVEKYKARFK